MNYAELKDEVYKLNRNQQLMILYKLLGWFEVSKDNAEFIRALESGLKEFENEVKL